MNRSVSRIGLFGGRAVDLARLSALLDAEVVLCPKRGDGLGAVAAHGAGARRVAEEFARRAGLPLLHLDDGFLRSVGDARDPQILSLLVDDLGSPHDASKPSRLERLLEESEALDDPALLARARRLRERIARSGLTATNEAPAGGSLHLDAPHVVIVVEGDAARIAEAVRAAKADHPGAVLVAYAPRGGVDRDIARDPRVRLVTTPKSPRTLLARAEAVYVVESRLGFDALLLGRTVHCFGAPFYAGWGLSRDRDTFTRRTRRLSLDQLVLGALVLYPRYLDPERLTPCEVERVVDFLALQRARYEENARRIFVFGVSRWKQAFLQGFLESPGRSPIFVEDAAGARKRGFSAGDVALVWGAHPPADVEALVASRGGELHRMEDGFLRSVRLGAELAAPASLVIDRRGIYFDPTRESDLEHLLEHAELTPEELERAAALRRAIVAAKVSKYNVGARRTPEIPASARGRVVLVPGQVEDDASIELGGVDVKTNLDLLREVRRARPDAFVIYKPHPDVYGGHRKGAVDHERAVSFADLVVTDLGLPECLEVADEVHTITSLVGFEALLREKRVFAYGLPFYAGWGLTVDRHRLPRRTRRRTLDELVACTLLRYPRYRSEKTGAFASPEHILEELERARLASPDAAVVRFGAFSRVLRKLANLFETLRHAR